MPEEVRVTRAGDLKASGPQTEGMIRQAALVDVSDQVCGTLMIAKPHTASAVHHHGEEDTIVYCVSGHGSIVSGPNGSKREDLSPGDWALIPSFAEHQEVNDSDGDIVWVICRGGRTPIVENLQSWTKS
ncbi:hypothetical protein NA57DRAFT_52529 [Rhizodiscina lignyota]|uniref:Cupin type-2 domain-containing protein n=1 Tax=Rhizodiscina lignyota TaxID=1504668 RepID=A0A9P4IR50_9PEZI|nr:hypothetical protein NA57DRAFT_52529 [Rhizodiscina lignyota]